jgi:hypothetical protein
VPARTRSIGLTDHTAYSGKLRKMPKATVRSFDIFDTLVARRCVHPFNIFYFVERRSSLEGFTKMRVLAERSISGQDYDLLAIYRAMQALYNIDSERLTVLMKMELEEEFANLIPIRENCRLVAPGDLLVSDMYLPLPFLLRVVNQKCGLKFNQIYLTTHGKSHGTAWSTLRDKFVITLHLGDNPHSDVFMAEKHGIPARLTEISKLTDVEQYLSDSGFEPLAWAVREARLDLSADSDATRAIALGQIEANFPLLYLSSLMLVRHAAAHGWKTLLFSARDCYYWHDLFSRLATAIGGPQSHYFLTSRLARSHPSESYMEYFKSLCGDGPTAIVDIAGTGWSLTRLLNATSASEVDIFFLHRIVSQQMMRVYQRLGGVTEIRPIVNLLTEIESKVDNSVLEAFNLAPHKMVCDIVAEGGTHFPIFCNLPENEDYCAAASVSHRAFELARDKAAAIPASHITHMLSLVQNDHIQRVAQFLGSHAAAITPIQTAQMNENRPVLEMISERARDVAAPARW